ncbi:MAG: hypothetical protein VX777_10770 [Chlamydiota bacterium]|nr:hypothetical protein [Chlamydiota bacterium]
MSNCIHPSILVKNIYIEGIIDLQVKDIIGNIDDKTEAAINGAINGYRCRKGFSDKIKGMVYRIVQMFKAIFKKSDWHKALISMNKLYLYHTDEYIPLNDYKVTPESLEKACRNDVINKKEYNRVVKYKFTMKERIVKKLLKNFIALTHEKVKRSDLETVFSKKVQEKLYVGDIEKVYGKRYAKDRELVAKILNKVVS